MPTNGFHLRVTITLDCGHTALFRSPAPTVDEWVVCYKCPRDYSGLVAYRMVTKSPAYRNYKTSEKDEDYCAKP